MDKKRHRFVGVNPTREEKETLTKATHAAPSETDDAIFHFMRSLDCPRSLAVWLLYSNREHQQLVDLTVSHSHYLTAWEFRDAYLATEFLSKASFLELGFDRKKVAFEKFSKYEDLCRQTNNRFRNLSLDPLYRGVNVTLLSEVRRKISHILGDFDPHEMFDRANWGPGVTTLVKGEHVSSINKFHYENGITRDLYSLVGDCFPVAYPLWYEHLRQFNGEAMPFNFQSGNVVVTVPKNAKTDRVIAVEPGINLWFQKAIGTMIRKRLLRVGINLNTQRHNQRFAKEGSISNLLATVDFSSASDSIAHLLVREILPPRWYQVMNSTRSVVGKQHKEVIRWEKFSSMGNGFTFELESLIFFATAQAVAEHENASGAIYIHGDDVILPSSCADLFSSFSAFLGFNVNLEKTHVDSPFRESCGDHWYLGSDCKPVYLKDRLKSAETFYRLANSVRMLAHRSNFGYGCDHRFRRCWNHLYRRVPNEIRFGVPYGKGDSGFVVNFDEAKPSRARNGIEGYLYKGVVASGVKSREFEGTGVLLSALWVPELPPERREEERQLCINEHEHLVRFAKRPLRDITLRGNTYELRGRTKRSVKLMHTLQWYDLGPWC